MIRKLAGVALLVCSLTACAGEVRPLEGILVMVSSPMVCGRFANGDLGPTDNCGRLVIIESKGLVRQASPEPLTHGVLAPEVLSGLKTAIEMADFEALLGAPWEGQCIDDALIDREVTYDFMTTKLHACGTEIDRGDPLFVALEEALLSVGQPLP